MIAALVIPVVLALSSPAPMPESRHEVHRHHHTLLDHLFHRKRKKAHYRKSVKCPGERRRRDDRHSN